MFSSGGWFWWFKILPTGDSQCFFSGAYAEKCFPLISLFLSLVHLLADSCTFVPSFMQRKLLVVNSAHFGSGWFSTTRPPGHVSAFAADWCGRKAFHSEATAAPAPGCAALRSASCGKADRCAEVEAGNPLGVGSPRSGGFTPSFLLSRPSSPEGRVLVSAGCIGQ